MISSTTESTKSQLIPDGERRSRLAALCADATKRKPVSPDGPASEDGLLSLFDLLCIGIGGTVGSGVFVLTGSVMPVAGPSASLSWLLAGLICLLSSFSFMEMSARVPQSGSTYAFSYHALGELPAVIASVCLTIEYGVSGAGVARSWADKLMNLIGEPTLLFAPYSTGQDVSSDVGADFAGALLQAA